MTDRLAALFSHFSLKASSFNSGPLCGLNEIENSTQGQLHLIRSGNVAVWHGRRKKYFIEEPSLLFYPKPLRRRFQTNEEFGAEFLCANVSFEGEQANPIVNELPESLCQPLSSLPHCEQVLTLLFIEADACYCGHQVVLDRLFEVLLVQLLRELMESEEIKVGMLAGLSDKRLRRAIVAIHDRPNEEWTVQTLAEEAHMSRTPFTNLFREKVGETPVKYLQRWRIGLVKKWLKGGQPLRLVAEDAGYKSESALSRAFKSQCGVSPREWLLNANE
ncbi:AraC family transcriptional regulator [Sessilibacter corallicola]|uniref:AraC family transcriptional regulator n=1 Tax=Sessilibacter corallicola TaxID=2904075 RepID=A0ABQ0AE43_9GAMM